MDFSGERVLTAEHRGAARRPRAVIVRRPRVSPNDVRAKGARRRSYAF